MTKQKRVRNERFGRKYRYKPVVFKLCVSTPPLRIIVNIRTSPKNSPAGSPLRIVNQEAFRLPFASPLRIVRASQFEKR